MLRTLHVLTSVILRTTLKKVYLLSSFYKWTDWCAKKLNQYLGSHSKYWGPGLKLEQCGSGVHAHGLGAIQLYTAHGPYFPVLVNLVLICLQRSLKMLGSTQSTLIRFCLFFGFCLFVYASERYLLWSCWFLIALLYFELLGVALYAYFINSFILHLQLQVHLQPSNTPVLATPDVLQHFTLLCPCSSFFSSWPSISGDYVSSF